MYNGVINVYKEQGFTSHDVVAKLRGILHMKKIGHTGTLDPDAVGVLPVCVGSATKLCDMLTDKTKTYIAVMKLGIITDTQDMSGTVLKSFDGTMPDRETIVAAINSFVGEYDQIPPMYSALKVNGKKLYELAREGIVVERKARRVCINRIEIMEMDVTDNTVKMLVDCSKGTYIRTLCNDIGEKLGCGACMERLTRSRVAAFDIDNAITLDEIAKLVEANQIDNYIIPVEKMFDDLESITTYAATDKLLFNGNKLMPKEVKYSGKDKCGDNDLVRVYDSFGEFRAVYIYLSEEKCYKPHKMFPKKNGE